MLKSRILFTVAACVVALAAMPASANIHLDENFEGASAFVDHDYPVTGETAAVTAESLLNQGVNLRDWAYDAASSTPCVVDTTGAVVTSRFFTGAKSLQLEDGEAVGVNGDFAARDSVWFKDLQFAISVDDAVYGLAGGTQIGHITWDFSTDNNVTNGAEAAYELDLVMNGSTAVDLKLGSTVLGTLTGSTGDWLVVTLIAQLDMFTVGGEKFECLDPLTGLYKGPQPTGTPTLSSQAGWPLMVAGITAFVNSNAGVLTAPADIDAAWGALTNDDPGKDTDEIDWEIAAENGGILYVDEMYWGTSAHQQAERGYDGEAAARLICFDAEPDESAPVPPPPGAAVGVWEIFY